MNSRNIKLFKMCWVFFSLEQFSLKSITIYLMFRTSYSGFEALFSKKHVNGRNRNTENRVVSGLTLSGWQLVPAVKQQLCL